MAVSEDLAAEILVRQDPAEAASAAGLHYVSDEETPGISRRKSGLGFSYTGPGGRRITDSKVIDRIRRLAIPPAWTEVWIAPSPDAHILATGRDAKGRKQYRYHPDFVAVRDDAKYGRLVLFASLLPDIRRAVARDVGRSGMPREKVLATIVHLLETTLIRIGNEDYAKENGSFGLTTLRNRHVQVQGSELRFLFKGKSGKTWRLKLRNRRVANVVRACQELPGQHLFQYQDASGDIQKIASGDVNTYLRELTGHDITAKDFRTWAGTVLAARAFSALPAEGSLKRRVRSALEQVAAQLGNTVAVCRKCYVHPKLIAAYEDGALALDLPKDTSDEAAELSAEEAAVYAFLRDQ